MIPVVKGGEPKALTEAKRDIRNTPDAPFDYSSLQGENKRKVLEALVVEQGHLCAYCMCRIGTDNSPATIEHIIPQHPTSLNPDGGLSLSKIVVVILMSVGLCVVTFLLCMVGGFIAGEFPDLNVNTLLQAALLYLTGGMLIPIAILPIVFLATLSKGYVLPIGATLLYLVPVVIAPAYLMGLHPLASVMGIYARLSPAAAEMVGTWTQGATVTATPVFCFISILIIGTVSAVVSVIVLKKQSY